jgi:hypothetical protein
MGGGGGGYTPPSLGSLQQKILEARELEESKLQQQINEFLRARLAEYNQRDVDAIRTRLDEIEEAIDVDFQRMLFGGSVAKHTYVDGLSDVDALAILDRESTQGLSAQDVLDQFHSDIDENLPRESGISEIKKGHLAVTVKYRDGSEIQVLPAVRVGDEVRIPDASGRGWKATNPERFRSALTDENRRLGMNLVPAIKLVKSLASDLPKQQRPTGYHIESLALDATKGYNGDDSVRALIDRILDRSSSRVLRPIADVTGQSRTVDEYLGGANSPERRLVGQAFGAIRRRLNATTSVTQWEAIFPQRSER